MFYKGVIFDLDNTLYDYDKCHKIALDNVFQILDNKYDLDYVQKSYRAISTSLKFEPVSYTHLTLPTTERV